MKKLVILLVSVLIGSSAICQTGRVEGYFFNESMIIMTPDQFYSAQRARGESLDNLLNEDAVKGSPYLNKAFISGEVIVDNYRFVGVPLRYNIYNDDIEYEEGDKILAIANPLTVKRVIINETPFVYSSYIISNAEAKGYFELLSDGEVQVLKKYKIVYIMGKAAQAYTTAEPPRFVSVPSQLYVKFGDSSAQNFKKAKSILKLFGDQMDEMQSYLKQEKLNIKKEGDLIKLITYYNSL